MPTPAPLLDRKKAPVSHLVGQGGVWAVCAQLAFKGLNPCFPGVDYGFDIMLDNGVRLQVKTAGLYMNHPAYPSGAYRFSTREQYFVRRGQLSKGRPRRDWKSLIDFFVFYGVDENRFFIVPVAEMFQGCVYIRRYREAEYALRDKCRSLREKGWGNTQIAYELGIQPKWVPWLIKPSKKTDKFLSYENRWDLLDVNTTAAKIIETVNPQHVLTDAGE